MGYLLPGHMRKKIIVLLLILLTIFGSLSLTSCAQDPICYFPEGLWDEFE